MPRTYLVETVSPFTSASVLGLGSLELVYLPLNSNSQQKENISCSGRGVINGANSFFRVGERGSQVAIMLVKGGYKLDNKPYKLWFIYSFVYKVIMDKVFKLPIT